MSDKKDDVKKLPQFKPYQIKQIIDKPTWKKWNEIHKPYINGLFHSAHLAQMINTNTVSNPRPKEQQDWLTKQGAKIKQARQDVAKVDMMDFANSPNFIGGTLPGQEHRKMLRSRRDIGIQSGTTNGHGEPKSPRDKEVLDRITGAVKGGKPISDPDKYDEVIQLGMKKDDKK